MAKNLSAATRLKISRSLRGNKNAFSGGPKKKLSTRDKIANINAATKAKKANLSSDQIARRASVAKRLRAQARREEALGGGNPGELKTNAEAVDQAIAQSDRLKQGGLQAMTKAKSADDIRAATNKIREARAALKEGMPQKTRKQSQAKAQPKAKQNLNAPQTPPEQRAAALSPAQRRRQQRSKFEADQAKARQGGASQFARQQGAEVKDVPISGRGSRGGKSQFEKWQADLAKTTTRSEAEMDLRAGERGSKVASREAAAQKRREQSAIDRIAAGKTPEGRAARIKAQADAFRKAERQSKPKPPQSDTGTDRSGTFTKKVPVKGEKATRPTGRKAIETEQDLAAFKEENMPKLLDKLSRSIPEDVLRKFAAESIDEVVKEFGEQGGKTANDAIQFLFKRFG